MCPGGGGVWKKKCPPRIISGTALTAINIPLVPAGRVEGGALCNTPPHPAWWVSAIHPDQTDELPLENKDFISARTLGVESPWFQTSKTICMHLKVLVPKQGSLTKETTWWLEQQSPQTMASFQLTGHFPISCWCYLYFQLALLCLPLQLICIPGLAIVVESSCLYQPG